MKIILFLLPLIIFFSCSNRGSINDKSKRNENWVWWVNSKTGNGKWIPEIPFADKNENVADGQYSFFYFNGNLFSSVKYKNGKAIDTLFNYDIQGNLFEYDIMNPPTCNCNYVINNTTDTFCQYIIHDGICKMYTQNGILIEEGFSRNHKCYGVWTGYYLDGKKQYERNYIKDSCWEINYYENGQKQDSGYDFRHIGNFATCKEWFENGQIKADVEWRKDGVQEGLAKMYTENDSSKESMIESYCHWKNGVQDGILIKYYKNTTQIEVISNWKNGIQDGIYIDYYDNGQIKDSDNFVYGHADGECKKWYKNGNLKP